MQAFMMLVRRALFHLLITGLILLAGCAPILPAQDSTAPRPTITLTLGPKEVPPGSTPATPPPGPPIEVTEVSPSLPIPSIPGLDALVEEARADLSKKLGIPEDQVSLLTASEVNWPDSSLGCPQSGMAYSQIVTRGYLVRLSAGGMTYEYHAALHGDIFYCPDPQLPVPGTPGGMLQ
jgi:hypothetical protein